jgi:peptidyl-prolyl cis-trans isomerase D
MAKRPSRPKFTNRRTVSRLQREAQLRQWLYIGSAILFGVIVILIGWGVYTERVVKPRRVVAEVHGDVIRQQEYERMVSFRQYTTSLYANNLLSQRAQFAGVEGQEFLVEYIDQELQRAQDEYAMLPTVILEEMIEDRLIRQEAARRGITVTEEEVQVELEEQFGYYRDLENGETAEAVDPEVITDTDQVMTHDEFVEYSASYFVAIRQATGFSEQDFYQLLESELYRYKVEQALTADMPTSAEQVRALHILVETEEEAEQVLARLAEGEAFEDLAREVSIDTFSGQDGGELGWFARGFMVDPFEEAAFALAPSETSGIVQTQFGYHIIRVLEHEEDRPLDDPDLEYQRTNFLDAWYYEQKIDEGIEIYWDASMAPS